MPLDEQRTSGLGWMRMFRCRRLVFLEPSLWHWICSSSNSLVIVVLRQPRENLGWMSVCPGGLNRFWRSPVRFSHIASTGRIRSSRSTDEISMSSWRIASSFDSGSGSTRSGRQMVIIFPEPWIEPLPRRFPAFARSMVKGLFEGGARDEGASRNGGDE